MHSKPIGEPSGREVIPENLVGENFISRRTCLSKVDKNEGNGQLWETPFEVGNSDGTLPQALI